MANFTLSAYKLLAVSGDNGFRIILGLGGKTPTKKVEARTLKELKTHYAEFAEEMKATGWPWQISDLLTAGRAPNGYKAAERELRTNVNTHLLPADGSDFDWSNYKG